ncbi:peroxiredoxin [Pedobacter africanus]|uniref:Peroxiredoxin n=1 Tax=Pedobacter africanus TaxID=151894 RepID=A0ACC6KRJ0_9SPHI|nr:hypothetical protein [Pedobacter africanus]MDR6781805.1 peroxiredoxin [Pedobacter africanus]
MKRLFFAFILSLFSTVVFAQAPAVPIVGTDMPLAGFYRADGSVFSTEQIPKGTKSFIMLFDATCEHCQKVISNFSKRSKELEGANFYLVSQDEYRSINYFMDNFGKPLKTMKNVMVLQDRNRIFIPLFHPQQYPSMYLYGKDKKLELYSANEKDVPRFISRVKSK